MEVKIIFGPPGTGKTTRLLDILEEELKTHHPYEIAYVSFTREGAYQGRDRALKKFDYNETDFPYFRTLHSIAFRELGMKRTQIINKKDYKLFSQKMGMSFTGYYTDEFNHNDDLYLFFNILHRNNPKSANNYLYLLDINKLRFVYKNYQIFKDYYKIYDFTDLIELFNKQNKGLPIKVAIVDEAQDLTTLQWKMILIAFKNVDRLYIAGDDDQAIYEWSGADVNYFINLAGDIEILAKSYRLPRSVLDFSKTISSLIQNRVKKDFEGTGKEGNVSFINNLEELQIDSKETWLFLSRNQFFLKEIREFVMHQGLIFESRGERSVTYRKISAIKRYEKAHKRRNISQQDRIILRPDLKEHFDIQDPWYNSFKWSPEELMYYRDIIANKTNLSKCNIKIDTIHAVKGGEADNVVVLLDITRQVSLNLNKNPDSEHRVFYVGCTRAKKNLYVKYGDSRYQYSIGETG